MRTTPPSIRTTVYLTGAAVQVVERVKAEYRDRYGISTNLSSVFSRLLLGESADEVIARPFRSDLARIASERDGLRDELRRARGRQRANDLRRIHREIADLYPAVKRISNTLGRAKGRNGHYSPDFSEAARIEESLDELMAECAGAIVPGRRR